MSTNLTSFVGSSTLGTLMLNLAFDQMSHKHLLSTITIYNSRSIFFFVTTNLFCALHSNLCIDHTLLDPSPTTQEVVQLSVIVPSRFVLFICDVNEHVFCRQTVMHADNRSVPLIYKRSN